MTQAEWHLDKKVPIGLIIGVVTQLVLLVIFFVKMDNRIEAIENWKIETSANRFTSDDAVFLDYKISENQKQIVSMDEKLDTLVADMAAVKAALNIPGRANMTMLKVAKK